VAAFAQGLTPRQSDGWIWLPDILGCICFLVSGHLAMLEVGAGHIVIRPRLMDWWVVAVNQVGSVLFFLAGIAAFVRPATSQTLDVALVNWGTFAGAVCFAIGGVIQTFDTPDSVPAREVKLRASGGAPGGLEPLTPCLQSRQILAHMFDVQRETAGQKWSMMDII